MEKPSKEFDILANKLLEDAGLEHPSAAFKTGVMNAIALKSSKKVVYEPLISKRGWWIVASVFIVSMILLYLFPLGGVNQFSEVKISELIQIRNPFKGLEIPKTALYGIGCLTLFLLQIPFLKRLVDKSIR